MLCAERRPVKLGEIHPEWDGNEESRGKYICVTMAEKKKDSEDTWQMAVRLIHLQSFTSHFHMLSKHIKNVSFSKWWTVCARVKLGKTLMQNRKILTLLLWGLSFLPVALESIASRVWPKTAASSNAIPLIASYRLSFCFLNSELKLEQMRAGLQITLCWLQDTMLRERSCPAVLLVCH